MGRTFQRQTESRVTPPEYIRRVLRQARRLWPFFIVGVIAAALIAYFGISFRVAETVTQVERVPLDPPAGSIAATHEDVTFISRDGTVLNGWWFEVARADRAVVIVHGRGRKPRELRLHGGCGREGPDRPWLLGPAVRPARSWREWRDEVHARH